MMFLFDVLYGENFTGLVSPNKVINGMFVIDKRWPHPVSFEIPNKHSLAYAIV